MPFMTPQYIGQKQGNEHLASHGITSEDEYTKEGQELSKQYSEPHAQQRYLEGWRKAWDESKSNEVAGISPVAQSILTVIKESTKRPGSYITGWHICDQLGVDRSRLGVFHDTKYDVALKELIDAGLVEELPDLGCRYRLCKSEE
jgi:hypothetical protein